MARKLVIRGSSLLSVPDHYDVALIDDDAMLYDADIRVCDHVQGGATAEDYDHGEVVAVDGNQVEVAWRRAECRTTQSASALAPYSADDDERLTVEA